MSQDYNEVASTEDYPQYVLSFTYESHSFSMVIVPGSGGWGSNPDAALTQMVSDFADAESLTGVNLDRFDQSATGLFNN